MKVERGIESTALHLDESQIEDANAYPIEINLHHLRKAEIETSQTNAHNIGADGVSRHERGLVGFEIDQDDTNDVVYRSTGKVGESETVHAKYVISCEGAHSWTRRTLGFIKEGEYTDDVWGVIDVIPITDFPDIRKQCTIQSKFRTMLNVPRENKLTRLYIQLAAVDADSNTKEARNALIPEKMFATAAKIMAPYKLTYTYCDWWTVFWAGQRVSNNYSSHERIFLAGNAVHSHTPKGGQGMNVSMQDAFNLGWKIGGVLNGPLHRFVLKTYEAERRPVAQQLIALDSRLSRMLSGKPNREELDRVYDIARTFLSGTNVRYEPSPLVAGVVSQPQQDADAKVLAKGYLATYVVPGKRLPSYQVARQSNACIWETQDLLKSDGCWRLIVFGGDLSNAAQLERVNALGENLAVRPAGVLKKYISTHTQESYRVQVILIHCAPKAAHIEMSDFHGTFFPFDEQQGYDYDRIYGDVLAESPGGKMSGDAHKYDGIDPVKGCMVATRPDQYVGWIGDLEDVDDLERYFDGCLNSTVK